MSAQTLEPGRPLEATLRAGETRTYTIAAAAGQYFRAVIHPNGCSLRIRLLAPSGAEIATATSAAGEQRDVPVSNIADDAGTYVLVFGFTDADAPPRSYTLRLDEIRTAGAEDAERVAAERAFQAGKQLQAQGSKTSLEAAIKAFESALPLWRAVSDKREEGRTLDAVGETWWSLGQPAKAKAAFTQALSLAREAKDPDGEASALTNLGVVAIFAEPKKALEQLESSLPLSRAAGDQNLEAETLSNIGALYLRMGDPRKSLEYAARAVELKRESGDRKGELSVLTNLATVYSALGDQHRALDALKDTLPLRRQWRDQRGEAQTLATMGAAFYQLGEPDKALECFQQAVPLRRAIGDRIGEAEALQNSGAAEMALGSPHEALTAFQSVLPISRELNDRHLEESALTNIARAYLQLGDRDKALDYTAQALKIQRQISDARGEAMALASLGSVYAGAGDSRKALQFYDEALPLLRAAADRAGEADTLSAAGTTVLKQGDAKRALQYFERELDLSRQVQDRRRESVALVNEGSAYLALGEQDKAADGLRLAVSRLASIGDRMEQSRALYYSALVEKSRRQWDNAKEHLQEALGIDEQLRAGIIGADLRSSYFATVADHFDALIDVLMHLDKTRPNEGFDVQAFETAERARARSLLDLLGEARGELRQGVAPELLNRERVLTAQLHAKTERQIQMAVAKEADRRLPGVEADIRRLTTEYEELQAKILSSSPRYAAFAYAQPASLRDIQRQFLDPRTLLLEYSMGQSRSFVWAVTSSDFHCFELPGRAALEAMVRRMSEGITSADPGAAREAADALAELSRALLAPVAGVIGNRRLVIVPEGALELIPFPALPSPTNAEPLVVTHEIVKLPSASTIAFLRRQRNRPSPKSKTLAVLADPVFSPDDPRLSHSAQAVSKPAAADEVERSASGFDRTKFERLPFTRKEAVQILELVRARESLPALDFDASRETAMSGQLSQYRFIHLASHGLVNSLHPELSAVVLSLVDRAGRPRNGFLQTTDIYRLKLNADLVVLSACQTALGQEVRGEGLVGLTRAFMYAGAPRVVASLWTVPDMSTAELMRRFYRGMLANRLRPPEALRQAQVSMWKEQRWARPYYWAAFTLEGEWR